MRSFLCSLPLLSLLIPTMFAANPLLVPSPLPYELPPFEQIRDEDFTLAYLEGMTEELREIDMIARDPAPVTFENTIVALERSGQTLDRVQEAFGILNGALTNPTLQKIETDFAPKLAEHRDLILLNPRLFARINELYQRRATLVLDPESAWLLDRYYRSYVRAGAQLSASNKEKLKAINTELATLGAKFSQNVLKEVNAAAVIVDTREELDGLSAAQIAAAAEAAEAAGQKGKFAIRLVNTTGQPPLELLKSHAVRERIMAASLARGSSGGEFDNREVVARIAGLRAERALLLGYPSHAAYQVELQTAETVGAINKLLDGIAPAAIRNARREAADLQSLIDSEKGGFQLGAADWAYFSEKVRQARYNFDDSQLRPYYEMKRVLVDGIFFAATKLYGITFKERPDLKGYTPDMLVYEVFNEDGSALALFLADFYARPSKRGGAWMNQYVNQSTLLNRKPVVGMHLNVPKPPAGEPTLLTDYEVVTAFHEFGHVLHGMFSNVRYPRFSGAAVPRDFVEFPSQVNEMWAKWPEVLKNYAKHYQTGAPMPAELVEKVEAAKKFNQGYSTTELVAANYIDQALHQLKPDQVPDASHLLEFEAAALKSHGVDFTPVPPRYRTTYYSHVMSGGYSAGYYSYFWAEVLDADSVEWFRTHGGLTRENGEHFRKTLLSRGYSAPAMDLFRAFRGADPDIKPFLRRRGLELPE